MRRSSLSGEQAATLAALLRERREMLGKSMRAVCAASGCNISTLSMLEAGTNMSPQPDTLKAIARALNLSIADLFVAIDWLPADELPALRPYLRSRYRDLTDTDVAAIDAYAARLNKRHGGTAGPTEHEDEFL